MSFGLLCVFIILFIGNIFFLFHFFSTLSIAFDFNLRKHFIFILSFFLFVFVGICSFHLILLNRPIEWFWEKYFIKSFDDNWIIAPGWWKWIDFGALRDRFYFSLRENFEFSKNNSIPKSPTKLIQGSFISFSCLARQCLFDYFILFHRFFPSFLFNRMTN